MSPGVRAGKASRRNFSRALARKTILIVMKRATDVTYRYSWLPMCKRDLISGLHFSSRQWIVWKKVLPFVARKWAARWRLVGGRMGTATMHAKGDYGKRDLKGRRHFFAALLSPTCANCTRNWIFLSSWVPLARWRQWWARPQSGLSLSAERYIRLVHIRQKNCQSWVIDDTS